jgi:hypothetical protein
MKQKDIKTLVVLARELGYIKDRKTLIMNTATSCDFFHGVDLTQPSQLEEILKIMNQLTFEWPTQILCEWLALLDAKPTRNNSENMMRAVLIEVLRARHPDNANTINDTNRRFLQTATDHHGNAATVAELLAVHNYTHNPTLSRWLSQRTLPLPEWFDQQNV